MLNRSKLTNLHGVVFQQHNRGFVVVLAIIWSRKDADDGRHARGGNFLEHSVSFELRFVRADEGEKSVRFEELERRLVREGVGAGADVVVEVARAGRRGLVVGLHRIGPEQVAHGPPRRRLANSVDERDVLDALDVGADAAVHAEELVVDARGEWERVEARHEGVVDFLGVLFEALGFEVEVAGEMAALVVAAEEPHGGGIHDLVRQEKQRDFCGETPAIDVIAEEQILRSRAGFRRRGAASKIKQGHQIVVLPVNISANRHRAFDFQNILLL